MEESEQPCPVDLILLTIGFSRSAHNSSSYTILSDDDLSYIVSVCNLITRVWEESDVDLAALGRICHEIAMPVGKYIGDHYKEEYNSTRWPLFEDVERYARRLAYYHVPD